MPVRLGLPARTVPVTTIVRARVLVLNVLRLPTISQ